MVFKLLDIHRQRNKPWPFPCIICKLTQKWIRVLNIRGKAIKHPEENVGENFCDPGLGKDFLVRKKKQES